MSFESPRESSGSSRKRGRRPSAGPSSGRGANSRAESSRATGNLFGVSGRSSSSLSATRRAPFADFSSYMETKNQKLRGQFDADASASSYVSGDGDSCQSGSGGDRGIFCGVSIFVDGYTVPSHQELRMCMLKHGGRFENYFSRQTVTHIVCSQLAHSKMKNLRSFSRGLPVVKPAWIMDSVAANRLLNCAPYLLDQFTHATQKQQKLSAFFTPKISAQSGVNPFFEQIAEQITSIESIGCDSDQTLRLRKCDTTGREDSDGLDGQNLGDRSEAEDHSIGMKDESSIIQARQEFLPKSSSSREQHSTLGDPNFVENYFKNSRLHFIGTWRNRYQRIFVKNTSGASERKYVVNESASSKPIIIHVDMDSFFVSVVIRRFPELVDKPVAISHSDNSKGTAEISSANYPARQYGIKAGMFVREAKTLCPQLAIFPYDFNAYEEVADQFYTILHEYCPKIQAVSCDEAFLDATGVTDDPEGLASVIRKQIIDTTGCTASAGISVNMLMARLATRVAKPNGQFYIPSEKVEDYMKELPVDALPGIGYTLNEKLESHNIQTCSQLRQIPKEVLQKELGKKIGEMLWNYCRGIDHRMVREVQEMKSVGAEVNWGIRFRDLNDCHYFLKSLCKEVSLRLKGAGVRGRSVTIKVRKRKKGAAEPTKYLGCGECESMSKSVKIPSAIDDEETLTKIGKELFASCHVEPEDVRGIGLQLSKLESADIRHGNNVLKSWIASGLARNSEYLMKDGLVSNPVLHTGSECSPGNTGHACSLFRSAPSSANQVQMTSSETQFSSLPPVNELDIDVVKGLPPEIIAEMNEIYQGKLSVFISKHDDKLCQGKDGFLAMLNLVDKGKQAMHSDTTSYETSSHIYDKEDSSSHANVEANVQFQHSSPGNSMTRNVIDSSVPKATSSLDIDRSDLMPSSLSQVDAFMLHQLPEEVKIYLQEAIPAHRNMEASIDPSCSSINESFTTIEDLKLHLWIGKPPKWIRIFSNSRSLILRSISGTHACNGADGLLSSTLHSLSLSIPSLSSGEEECDEEILLIGSEFLRQYIELKVDTDIEELYICFCVLKRLKEFSVFFSRLYDNVLPSLQDAVCKNYGGLLQLSFAE
ncbi:DNA-directed DNA polymerase [Wolffia australiana]